jgi:hypothetical protein
MTLPDHLRQAAGLPKDIDIEGHIYKAIPMTTNEEVTYHDKYPSLSKMENGALILDTNHHKSGQVLLANAWAIFITLKKQCNSMKDDTFEGFLKEMDEANMGLQAFVLKFAELLKAIVNPPAENLKKKE